MDSKKYQLTPEQIIQGFRVDNNMLYDKNNNAWNLWYLSIKEAIKYSNSLMNCKNCKDCFSCTNCENCNFCQYCRNCLNCNDCEHCIHCEACINCINCAYRKNCECDGEAS